MEEAHGDRLLLLGILWNCALPLFKTGDAERATKLQSALATLWERDVRALNDEDKAERSEFRAELAGALDKETADRLWAEGETLTLKETIALAR